MYKVYKKRHYGAVLRDERKSDRSLNIETSSIKIIVKRRLTIYLYIIYTNAFSNSSTIRAGKCLFSRRLIGVSMQRTTRIVNNIEKININNKLISKIYYPPSYDPLGFLKCIRSGPVGVQSFEIKSKQK